MNKRENAQTTFLDAWTSMASLFSFSPSTARVSGLLLIAGEPLCHAEIVDRLGISRGNVSMCLKELRGWGIVQRVARPGDRREFYESRGGLFEQTLAIARERKRREFDPVVGSAIESLQTMAVDAGEAEAAKIQAMLTYIQTVDRLGRQVVDNAAAATALIDLLKVAFTPPASAAPDPGATTEGEDS